jgi:hypothetical protein
MKDKNFDAERITSTKSFGLPESISSKEFFDDLKKKYGNFFVRFSLTV